MNTTAIGGPPDARLRVDAVLLHPAHGIVLIDLAPRSTRRALVTLRQTLAAHGVQAWSATDIPLLYFCLTADELQGLPHLLRTIVTRRHEALPLATHPEPARCPDHRWTDEVQAVLTALDRCTNDSGRIERRSLAFSAMAVVGLALVLLGSGLAVRGPELSASLTGFWTGRAPSPGTARPTTDRMAGADDPTRPTPLVGEGRNATALIVDALTAAMSPGEAATGDNGTQAAVETAGGPATWPALVAPAVIPPPGPTTAFGAVPEPGSPQTPVLATSETITVPPPLVLPVRITDQDRIQSQPFLPPAFPAAHDPMLPPPPPPPVLPDVRPVALVVTPPETSASPALPPSDLVQMHEPSQVPAPSPLWRPTIMGQNLQAVEADPVAAEMRQPMPTPVVAASVLAPTGSGHPALAAPARSSVAQPAPPRADPAPASSVQAAVAQHHSARPGLASAATKQPAAPNVAPPAAASSRCGALLARLQLLERPSDAERDLLRYACAPR